MRLKSLFTMLAVTTALTIPALAHAGEVTFTTNMRNYGGDGAYLAYYVTDAQGKYAGRVTDVRHGVVFIRLNNGQAASGVHADTARGKEFRYRAVARACIRCVIASEEERDLGWRNPVRGEVFNKCWECARCGPLQLQQRGATRL